MLRFNIKDGDVVIDINSLGLPVFREVNEFGKKKNKRLANNMLYYIYLIADLRPTNPVRDFPVDEKEGEARMAAFGKENYKLSEEGESLLVRGIAAYDKHTVTSQERLLEQYDKSIDNARLLMANISSMVQNDEGDYVLNEDYTKFMRDVVASNKMMNAERDNLMKSILSGGNGKLRAGREVSHIEKTSGLKKTNFKGK